MDQDSTSFYLNNFYVFIEPPSLTVSNLLPSISTIPDECKRETIRAVIFYREAITIAFCQRPVYDY